MATVHIKSTGGSKVTLSDVDLSATVAALKTLVEQSELSIPAAQQRLIYKGQVRRNVKRCTAVGCFIEGKMHELMAWVAS